MSRLVDIVNQFAEDVKSIIEEWDIDTLFDYHQILSRELSIEFKSITPEEFNNTQDILGYIENLYVLLRFSDPENDLISKLGNGSLIEEDVHKIYTNITSMEADKPDVFYMFLKTEADILDGFRFSKHPMAITPFSLPYHTRSLITELIKRMDKDPKFQKEPFFLAKLSFNLNAEQLGILFGLMHDENIINGSRVDLAKFASRHFVREKIAKTKAKTKKSSVEQISYNAFKNDTYKGKDTSISEINDFREVVSDFFSKLKKIPSSN